MKKKLVLLFIIAVTVLTACSGKQQTGDKAERNKLPKNKESLTWWGDRSKPFGNLEYAEITEKEALDLLQNKFELKVPDYYTQAKKIVEDNLTLENTQRKELYNVVAEGEKVRFTIYIQVSDNQEKNLSYAKIELIYLYIPIQEKVKLLSQELSLFNQTNNEAFSTEKLPNILKQITELLHLKDQDKLLSKFSEETKDIKAIGGKDIIIVRELEQSNRKQIFGQNFGVLFKGSGDVESIYSITKDERL